MSKKNNSITREKEINKKLTEFCNGIRNLDEIYDAKFVLDSFITQIGQLDYFHRHIGKDNFYYPKIRPKEGQIACFQLLVGFPKEIKGRHWCYILKDLGCKMLVIPVCSVKAENLNSGDLNQSPYIEYIDVVFSEYIKSTVKMSYSDMRTVDIQRLDIRRPFAECLKPREEIAEKLIEIIKN